MRERELKMVVPRTFEVPDLDDAIAGSTLGGVEPVTIDDTYFDTADLRLARWGCTLRHRAGEGWTVKIPRPSSQLVLDRVEVAVPGESGSPPVRVLNLVSSLTRGAAVAEVAQVHTVRSIRRWVDEEGALVAELADDIVTGSRPAGEPVSFREIEVELAPHVDGAALDEIAARLSAAKRAVERALPKVVRVLGPDATLPPDVDVPALSAEPTAHAVIEAAFSASVAQLLLQLPAARLGVDPEGVHQARVAARRMRSDLKTFEPLLDADWSTGLGTELKWLIDRLGAVRDTDVLGLALEEVVQRHPAIDPLAAGRVLRELRLERGRARRRLVGALNTDRSMHLFDRLVDASRHPATRPRARHPARNVMPKLVRKRWKRLDRAIRALGRHPDPADLHAVRILAKRVRYAAEAVAPAAGKQARKFAARAEDIQDALGDLNDAAVAGAWLEATAPRLDGAAGFAAGRMTQVIADEVRVRHRQWRAAHQAMRKRTAWFS